MSKPDNPPAFPSVEEHPSYDFPIHHFGMELRDHFAGQMLAGLGNFNASVLTDDDLVEMCQQTYRIADAMLKARKSGD